MTPPVQPRHAHRVHGGGPARTRPVGAGRPGGVLPGRDPVGSAKPRAMEIIEELEPTRRGLYGGVVGYLDFAGDLDVAIAIRTAVVMDGIAYVQAGGGVVADSDPQAEEARAGTRPPRSCGPWRSPGRSARSGGGTAS